MKRRLILAGLILALIWSVGVHAQQALIDEARVFFEQLVRLSHEFDSSIADLYSDDALIQTKRVYPNGQVQVATIPAAAYKTVIRSAMPLAKLQGDISTYSNITFSLEGKGVRIEATRYSVLKDYESPYSLLVVRGDGQWRIYEEITETRP